jgi:hypothetical protein
LIVKNSLVTAMEFSRCARTSVRQTRTPSSAANSRHGPVSQNSTAFVEVDVTSRRTR